MAFRCGCSVVISELSSLISTIFISKVKLLLRFVFLGILSELFNIEIASKQNQQTKSTQVVYVLVCGIICGPHRGSFPVWGSFAEPYSAERAKKRYELARGRTRARTEAAENVESLWEAVFLLLRSTSVSQLLRQKKREIETKGARSPASVRERSPRSSPEGSSRGGTRTRHERTAEIEPKVFTVG